MNNGDNLLFTNEQQFYINLLLFHITLKRLFVVSSQNNSINNIRLSAFQTVLNYLSAWKFYAFI